LNAVSVSLVATGGSLTLLIVIVTVAVALCPGHRDRVREFLRAMEVCRRRVAKAGAVLRDRDRAAVIRRANGGDGQCAADLRIERIVASTSIVCRAAVFIECEASTGIVRRC